MLGSFFTLSLINGRITYSNMPYSLKFEHYYNKLIVTYVIWSYFELEITIKNYIYFLDFLVTEQSSYVKPYLKILILSYKN